MSAPLQMEVILSSMRPFPTFLRNTVLVSKVVLLPSPTAPPSSAGKEKQNVQKRWLPLPLPFMSLPGAFLPFHPVPWITCDDNKEHSAYDLVCILWFL